MFKKLKQLSYGVRVLLSRNGGQPEKIDVGGKPIQMMHAGSGTPFVYLHSTLGESFMWLPFYQSLSKHFQVYVPTHPGFPGSGGFDQITDMEDVVFHYVEMFDALGFDQEIILGGVSLGGWIAAEFATRWPERVKKLWIADAPGLWVPEQPLPDLFRHATNKKKMRDLLFHDPDGPLASLIIKDKPDEETMTRAYQSMTVLARLIWERPYNPRLADRLRRVKRPTLLLWGDSDKLVPPAYGEAYKQHLPHAAFKLIPQCGHLPMFEKEREFVDALVKFCKE